MNESLCRIKEIKGMSLMVFVVMAYFHCRRRIRTQLQTWILVLCRIFPLVQIQTLIP